MKKDKRVISPIKGDKMSRSSVSITLWAFLCVVPLLWSSQLIDPAIHLRFLAWAGFSSLLFVALLFTQKMLFQVFSRHIAFVLVSVAYLVVSVVSLFMYKVNMSDGMFELAKILLYILYILMITSIFETNRSLVFSMYKPLVALVFIAVLWAMKDLAAVVRFPGLSHNSLYKVNASFANKNIFAEVMLVVFPFCVWAAFFGEKVWKQLSFLAAILASIVVVFLLSRAAWVGFVLALVSTTLVIVFFGSRYKKTRLYVLRMVIICFTSIVVASVLVIVLKPENPVSKQITSAFNTKHPQTYDRVLLWERTLDVVKENCLFGTGLGSWKIEILKKGTLGLKSQDNLTFYLQPHNDYLWVLSEQGLLALLLFVAIYALVIFKLLRSMALDDTPEMFFFKCALLFSIIAYLTISFFAFPKERIEHLVIHGLVVAFVLVLTAPASTQGKDGSRFFRMMLILVMACALVFSLVVGFKRFYNEQHARRVLDARMTGNVQEVIDEANKATGFFYQIDPLCTPLTWYRGEARFLSGDIAGATTDFEDAYHINPHHVHVLNNLATCREMAKNHDQAIALYKEAIRISPTFDESLINLAIVYYNLNVLDSSLVYLQKVDTLSKNKKLEPCLNAIPSSKVIELSHLLKSSVLIADFKSMSFNKELCKSIFQKSISNGHSFKKQVLDDFVFLYKARSGVDSELKELVALNAALSGEEK